MPDRFLLAGARKKCLYSLPLFPHPQRFNKRFLRNAHITIIAHPGLALFLLLQQLLLARDVAAVAFGGHFLAQRGDCFAGDLLAADGGLGRDL